VSVYDQDRRESKHLSLPPRGASADEFKAFFNSVIDPESPGRIELVREWNIARAMFLSHQWLDLNTSDRDARRAVRFTDPNPKMAIPRPVTNECLPLLDNEMAKLVRRKSTAYVRPVALQAGTQGSMGAAKATDIMEWHLETIRWPRKYRSGVHKDVLYGTVYWWSYLDQSFLDSVKVGITEARRCISGSCGKPIASLDIPADAMLNRAIPSSRYERQTNVESDSVSNTFTAKYCLDCGGPLVPHIPIVGESPEQDAFGRDLFTEQPKNMPNIEVPSVYDIYPDNEGQGFEDPTECKRWYRCTPRSIDGWLEEHYAHHPELGQVKRDSQQEIVKYHPVQNEYSHDYSGTAANSGRNLWRNHVLVKTAVEGACKKYPKGRYVEYGGGVLLRDEDLFRESKRKPGVIIPLVTVATSRFFVRDGELIGQGPMVGLRSPQNRINMTDSQIVDTRQRNGVSGIMGTTGMKFTSGWLDGYTGRFVKYDPDPQYPNRDPQFIETKTMDQGVYQERDRVRDFMQNFIGAQDVDIGKAPRNVSAATAIQVLQEQAQGRRAGREQELIDAFKEIFSHQLLLLAEFAEEPREYRVEVQNSKWELRSFTGQDLEGHTDVMVEEQAAYDARAFEREAMAQAINVGALVINTPYARREAGRVFGINPKIADEENAQISDAEGKWYAFRDEGLVPSVDPSLDDHWVMYTVYGKFLKAPEAVQMAIDAKWPETLDLIAGWEAKLLQAQMMDQQVRLMQGQASGGGPMGETASMALNGIVQQGQSIEEMLLPLALQNQILFVWQRMGADTANPFVQFRAVFEAHKSLGEQKKVEATMMPKLAAPGGAQTPEGTEPVSGSAPAPGPTP